jgi:hypothetical protein
VEWSDDRYWLRYLVVDYLGLIHVLSNCRKPPRYVPYKGTYVPYDGTFGAPDQGQMLDV